jgi:hypothetical protein
MLAELFKAENKPGYIYFRRVPIMANIHNLTF